MQIPAQPLPLLQDSDLDLGLAVVGFRRHPGRDIPHGGEEAGSAGPPYGAERNLNRELLAVSPPAHQFQTDAHRPLIGILDVACPMGDVGGTDMSRDQNLDLLAQQFVPGVTEHGLDTLVDQEDGSVIVGDHDAVR